MSITVEQTSVSLPSQSPSATPTPSSIPTPSTIGTRPKGRTDQTGPKGRKDRKRGRALKGRPVATKAGNRVDLRHGNSMDVLKSMPDNSVDSVVTDPPYGLCELSFEKYTETLFRWATGERDFMPTGKGYAGMTWDAFVPPPALWDEVFRVLKPGGHVLAFAGSRTSDLMSISMRIAGFEMRDVLMWVYSTGMPRGLNIGKAMENAGDEWVEEAEKWQGWNTTLKPSYEPIIMARKPLAEAKYIENIRTYGVGGINIAENRIGDDVRDYNVRLTGGNFGGNNERTTNADTVPVTVEGRYPKNVFFGHAPECDDDACFRGCPVAQLDASSARTSSPEDRVLASDPLNGTSRFFSVSKPSDSERVAYLDADGKTVKHVTVKPVELMRQMVRLITPEGGTVLEPFAGSGTTVEAALLEPAVEKVIAIEMTTEYVGLTRMRVHRAVDALSSVA